MTPRPARLENPFRFGDLALDDTFADRAAEVAELTADALNGQNVVIIAPRRYGKTSLVEQVAHRLVRKKVLVGQMNLMMTPSKEQFVEQLTRTIYDDIASPITRAQQSALDFFRGLRVTPRFSIDPNDGAVSVSVSAGHSDQDLDATLIRLLELPAEIAADRGRRVAIIFDEFQEVVGIDPNLPALMRSVFQRQPAVSHIYLGSKRHMMARIFNDRNEPFWRSAKHLELAAIPRAEFVTFIEARFAASGKQIEPLVAERIVEITDGHPYGTQELAYAVWEAAATRAGQAELDRALDAVLRSENAHFATIWDNAAKSQRLLLLALAREPGGAIYSEAYRARHRLGPSSSVQNALRALVEAELAGKRGSDGYHLVEPFLTEWLERNVPDA